MAKGRDKLKTDATEQQLPFNAESLQNYSRQELIELAKNLSDGKYKKDSRQRDKIMQMIVKLLSSLDESE